MFDRISDNSGGTPLPYSVFLGGEEAEFYGSGYPAELLAVR